jgi:hypothetical protein
MSDITTPLAQEFDTVFRAGETGLVGTVAYRIDDNDGNVVSGPTTAGIVELGTTGAYAARPTAPGSAGEWSVIWSRDGSFDPDTVAIDALTTYDPGTAPVSPGDLPVLAADGVSSVGPCSLWVTAAEVADYCGGGSDSDLYEDVAVAASQVLYALVPRFPGSCTRSVRPCTGICGVSWAYPYSDYLWFGDEWRDAQGAARSCGCHPLAVVPLAGGVRSITEVLIDGQIVDASTYRVDERRRLVRLRDDDGDRRFWPGCQNVDAAATEDGTFEVTYVYGADPPAIGQMAAKELACAIYSADPDSALAEECVLPNGVTKIIRQGLTIELVGTGGFGFVDGVWKTGLPLVDMFLNAFNPTGRRKRRSSVWSPDLEPFPRPVSDPASS